MVSLEASKLFKQLTEEGLNAARASANEKTFQAGQEIFREGDSGDGLYILKEGLVEISALVNSSSRHVISKISAGDMFGEMAVLEDKPRSASARAVQSTSAYFISRPAMLKLIQTYPELSLHLLREISNRLREFNRQYLEETLQSERLAIIGRFARSIVHDLKNPLNVIGLTAELACLPEVTQEMREQSRARIGKQIDRISDMIGEILDFTQGSHSAFVLAAIDYGTFVEQMAQEIRPEAALKSADVELIRPLPSVKLLINPKRLRRVFFNLVHNATDAMAEGGLIKIRVEERPTEIVTEVEDTGPGIAREIESHLFEAFATHGKAHGTGLGLSICKKILDDHQGWIEARNGPSRGAIFRFGLPRPAR